MPSRSITIYDQVRLLRAEIDRLPNAARHTIETLREGYEAAVQAALSSIEPDEGLICRLGSCSEKPARFGTFKVYLAHCRRRHPSSPSQDM